MAPKFFARLCSGRLHYAWIVLGVMFLATLAGMGVRSAPGVIIVPLQRAFGWNVVECDGHDHADLQRAFAAAQDERERPTCIIAHTVKGKGVSFMEGNYLWHAQVPTDDDLARAMAELAGNGQEEAR